MSEHNQTPTPEAVIELMTKCLGAVEQVYSTTGRMPYLVDLDNPETVERIADVIEDSELDDPNYSPLTAARAVVAALRGDSDGPV